MKMAKKLYYILIAFLVIAIAFVVIKGINKENETVDQQEDAANQTNAEEQPEADPAIMP